MYIYSNKLHHTFQTPTPTIIIYSWSAGLARMKSLIVAVMMVAMMANSVVEGQDDVPVCLVNLLGCADSLNTTTTPPDTCCLPLKQAITDQLPCLCNLYNDPAFLKSIGINITQVIELPARCGINFSILGI